jgi:hypothetical protein
LYTYYECKNFAEIDKFDFDNILFVQYRIGDLFSLTNKTFISPQLLANLIQDKIKAFRQINLLVASDTPEKCIILIDYLGFDFTRKIFSPENTISAGLHARYFIGTNSKISLWIATLRALSSKESLIPVGFSKIQQVLLPLYFLKFVTYYDPLEIPNG